MRNVNLIKQEKNNGKDGLMMKVFFLTCMFIILFFFSACKKTITIDLNEFVNVKFDGYETRGFAAIEFDQEGFISKHSKDLVINDMDARITDLRKTYGNDVSPAELFVYCISWSLNKASSLSSGDNVQLLWHIDKNVLEKEFNCKLKYDDRTYVVTDLKQPEEFDPFEKIGVNVDGISPHAYASVRYGQAMQDYIVPIEGIEYQVSKTNDVANGDKICLSIMALNGQPVEEYLLEKFGLMPTRTTLEYNVSGLPYYINSIDDLGDHADDIYNQIQKAFSEKHYSVNYYRNYYGGPSQKPDDVKCYVYVNRDKTKVVDNTDSLYTGNTLYIGYKGSADVYFPGKEKMSEDFGIIVCVKNVIMYPDGSAIWDDMYFDAYDRIPEGRLHFYKTGYAGDYFDPFVVLSFEYDCIVKMSHYNSFWNGNATVARGYDVPDDSLDYVRDLQALSVLCTVTMDAKNDANINDNDTYVIEIRSDGVAVKGSDKESAELQKCLDRRMIIAFEDYMNKSGGIDFTRMMQSAAGQDIDYIGITIGAKEFTLKAYTKHPDKYSFEEITGTF